jgi:hypothetical protein
MSKTKIVWNGCDGYVEADDACRRGYDFDGETLFHGGQSFAAFWAVEITLDEITVGDGELDMSGVLGSESGKFYRAA